MIDLFFSFNFFLWLVALLINLVIIFFVYRSNPRSATNIIFTLLGLITFFWLIMIYSSSQPAFLAYTLWLTRSTVFLAVPQSMLFFLLSYVLPRTALEMRKTYLSGMAVAGSVVMILTLSPFVFQGIYIANGILHYRVGLGMPVFALFTSSFSIVAIYILIRKTRRAIGSEKRQLMLVMTGIISMLFLIITTIMVPVLLFQNGTFVPFAPLYTLIFLAMTAYAIAKYSLFNVKIIATETLVGIIWIILFAKIFIGQSTAEKILDSFTLVMVVVFGIFLIRSVRREVEQREQLQVLSTELEAANAELKKLDQTKSEFISIASHQLRAPLTVIKGYISLVREGSYGKIAATIEDALSKVAFSTEQLVKLVSDMLNLSRMESGKIRYEFTPVDFLGIVEKTIEEFRPNAEKKGLTIEFKKNTDAPLLLSLDSDKIREAVVNLIDNAIKYTPKGKIDVTIGTPSPDKVLLAIRDQGIGIKPEDMGRLFTKFVRTEDARKTDPNGTGIGLYFIKRIIQDHGGKVWAESEGIGKGSAFFVELQIKN